jgi:hypothetical protein
VLRRRLSLVSAAEVPFLARVLRGAPPGPPPAQERLVAAAIQHGVVGYVVQAARGGEVLLPQALLSGVESQHALAALHAALLRQELGQVLPLIRDACGVEPVLIKGPEVAERLYPQRTLRPFADLDLLVPAERMRAAAEALRDGLGYEPDVEPWSGYGERHGHEISLLRPVGAGRLRVELHWRLSDDPVAASLDHAGLLASANRLSLADGIEVEVPRPEEELLVLAVHLLHERYKRLVWVNDIALAARQASEAEWLGAFELARETGLGWVLDRGLDYAAEHLALDRPRPWRASKPAPWGPLRANERFDGWFGIQLGRLALGGWLTRDGYVRSAARARRAQLHQRLRGRLPGRPPIGS